jgi:outer membrane biosynthesis protein TonB
MTRTVWAFAELEELNGQMGFVAVDDDLAAELVKAGQVQDPYLTEPLKLMGSDPGRRSGRYATRQIKAAALETGPENGSDDATASATKPQQTPKPQPEQMPTPAPPPPPKPAEPKPEQMPKPAPPKPDQAPAESRARRGRPPAKAK